MDIIKRTVEQFYYGFYFSWGFYFSAGFEFCKNLNNLLNEFDVYKLSENRFSLLV
ncbi:hypothetical protein [Clostridium cylindrosporum]|uniref:Uncharacterized protein n=1 Tax=Clostridium cylindrosporum DSM 605 TaxID=1121307 RepID=A0A0J8DER9_CLOCY|nr:hypothetical protein [Clostridium cylindrosporum]KMT22729.1 hypothetical protein CLCY_11c00630 [Clostridium cylindrosporum DSM 605]